LQNTIKSPCHSLYLKAETWSEVWVQLFLTVISFVSDL
jgi:hypothetical protein